MKKTKKAKPSLRLTPYAWGKLLRLRDLGHTEVGGFGISAKEDLLLIEDVRLVQQTCTSFTVKFDDSSVADFFDAQVDAGLTPERFARIWIHTHPGDCPNPSSTDESTFKNCFGESNWAVMFIVAQGGQTYARLRFNTGPTGELTLPVEVDFTRAFPASNWEAWDEEYEQKVREELPPLPLTWRRSPERVTPVQNRSSDLFDLPEELVLESLEDGPWLDDYHFQPFQEAFDERVR